VAGSSRGRRTYARDNRGRFATTGTTTAKTKPAARRAQRGTNRITRDNSGRITGVGKNGVTARGGRLRTAAGNQRGAVLDRLKRRQSLAGTIRASDAAMARLANSASKRIERRNKSGENPPWAGRENSGSRLRRAKARIADQKARQGGPQAPMRPVSAGKLSRAKARAKAIEGRGQRIQQAVLSTQDSPVVANMRYAAARAAGTPIPKRELNRLTRDMRSYQKALRSTMTAQRAMAFYGKSKPKPAAPKQAKAARPSGTIRKPQGLKPGALAARKAKPQKSVKLSATQRSVAQRARDTFNDPTLLLNGRIAKGYKEGIQAIQQKFGVDNRIATLAFMRRAFRMGTSDIQYIDTARTKKTIKALRARTAIGSPIGGGSRKAKAPAIPGTVSRGPRKAATTRLAAPKQAKASRTAAKPARGKRKARVDDGRVSRVIGRLNNVVRGAEQKTGVKRLNAIQVGTRAKSFLARKEGGSVGMLNQMSQPEAFASVRKAMTKPPRYSTQKPNRNKPGRFNDLGQDKARIKARRDAMTARERIQEGNQSAAAKAKAQRLKLSRDAIRGGAWSRRELGYGTSRKGFARAARIKGTVPKPKREAKVSTTVARTRSQARASQRRRREITLNKVRTGVYGIGIMRKNPRIRAVDTGMSQLSLVGKPKKLKRYKPVK
jgi:hypothetical protein